MDELLDSADSGTAIVDSQKMSEDTDYLSEFTTVFDDFLQSNLDNYPQDPLEDIQHNGNLSANGLLDTLALEENPINGSLKFNPLPPLGAPSSSFLEPFAFQSDTPSYPDNNIGLDSSNLPPLGTIKAFNPSRRFKPVNLSTLPEIRPAPNSASLEELASEESTKKKRSRGPNKEPILKGNNAFGQRGTRSCAACRRRRQKCVYDNLADPCEHCSKRGLECTSIDKILGPKQQGGQEDGREDQVKSVPSALLPLPTDAKPLERRRVRLTPELPLVPRGIRRFSHFLKVGGRILGQPSTFGPNVARKYPNDDPLWCDVCESKCDWPWIELQNGWIRPRNNPNWYDQTQIPPPLSKAVESVSVGVGDVLGSLSSVHQTLLGVWPKLDTLEKNINSLLQFAAENTDHLLFISDFIRTFRKLDIRGIWAGLGEAFTNFSSKMNSLSGRVDILSKKFGCSIKIS